MLADDPIYTHSIDEDAWLAVMKPVYSGSSGVVILVSNYGLFLPHVGSSTFIVDCRPIKSELKMVLPEALSGFRKVVGLSIVEQMQKLLAALSLNKSQLAQILRVTRPTMYDWFQGKEPNAANAERLHTLLRILARASISDETPLNVRFVRQPIELDTPSLIDLLGEENLDEDRILHSISQVQALGDFASRRRTTREERLHALGFDDPSSEQRKEQLARNIALQNWPQR